LKKGESAFRLIVQTGWRLNAHGKRAPRQQWTTFRGTRKQAEERLAELVNAVNKKEYVEPTRITVGEWLDQWRDSTLRSRCRDSTFVCWKGIIENHLKPSLGHILLQQLDATHLETYYHSVASRFASATVAVHHALLSSALKSAVRKKRIRLNPAQDVESKPRRPRNGSLRNNVWQAVEARTFLATVKASGRAQDAAFFALALDSGMRRGELLGLQWRDLQGSTIHVERQLVKGGLEAPKFGVPKNGEARTLDLGEETLALLAAHKREQAELKMANRTVYQDHGLIFAQAFEHYGAKHSVLGAPLSVLTVRAKMDKFSKAASVTRITPHGMRHTCATLLLAAGVPPHVVQKRLGHKDIAMTLGIYAHVLPSQQAQAASTLATVLHGSQASGS
jgi:integrase